MQDHGNTSPPIVFTAHQGILNQAWIAVLAAWDAGDILMAQRREQLYSAIEQVDTTMIDHLFNA
jgi:hypothetical protein